MEAHYPVEVVISALEHCTNNSSGFVCMQTCPYVKMKDCLEALHADALYYIKKNPEQEVSQK